MDSSVRAENGRTDGNAFDVTIADFSSSATVTANGFRNIGTTTGLGAAGTGNGRSITGTSDAGRRHAIRRTLEAFGNGNPTFDLGKWYTTFGSVSTRSAGIGNGDGSVPNAAGNYYRTAWIGGDRQSTAGHCSA